MQKEIYTIGYSGFQEIGDFVDVLKKAGVNVLVDVRSSPYSSYFLPYNKDQLKQTLRTQNIYYRNYAREFGAQQTDRRFFSPQGYLDFGLFSVSEPFRQGYRKVEEGLRQHYVFALMCAEKDPIDCHRSIMISKNFSANGYTVLHLLPNESPISQCDIEAQLLNKYFPNRDQLSFFETQLSEADLISEAYRKRNADIGYYLEEASA